MLLRCNSWRGSKVREGLVRVENVVGVEEFLDAVHYIHSTWTLRISDVVTFLEPDKQSGNFLYRSIKPTAGVEVRTHPPQAVLGADASFVLWGPFVNERFNCWENIGTELLASHVKMKVAITCKWVGNKRITRERNLYCDATNWVGGCCEENATRHSEQQYITTLKLGFKDTTSKRCAWYDLEKLCNSETIFCTGQEQSSRLDVISDDQMSIKKTTLSFFNLN